jgi:hypothetical protein
MALASVLALLTGAACVAGRASCKAGFGDRAAVEARARGLHQRHRGHRARVAAPEASRVLGGGGTRARVGARVRARGSRAGANGAGGARRWASACLGLILVGRARAPSSPAVLVAVAGARIAVTALGLEGADQGGGGGAAGACRCRRCRRCRWHELGDLLVAAVGIALVSFADTSVLSRTLAGRAALPRRPEPRAVRPRAREPGGGALFQGFPISAARRGRRWPRRRGAQVAGDRGGRRSWPSLVLLLAAPAPSKTSPRRRSRRWSSHAAIRLFDVESAAGVQARVRLRRFRPVARRTRVGRVLGRAPRDRLRGGPFRCSTSCGERGAPMTPSWGARRG